MARKASITSYSPMPGDGGGVTRQSGRSRWNRSPRSPPASLARWAAGYPASSAAGRRLGPRRAARRLAGAGGSSRGRRTLLPIVVSSALVVRALGRSQRPTPGALLSAATVAWHLSGRRHSPPGLPRHQHQRKTGVCWVGPPRRCASEHRPPRRAAEQQRRAPVRKIETAAGDRPARSPRHQERGVAAGG